MALELTEQEYDLLSSSFFSLSNAYQDDDWSKENIVEHFIGWKFNFFKDPEKNKISGYQKNREMYYIIQKFIRIYPFENPPLSDGKNVGWAEYICDEVNVCKDTDQEAYEWISDIFKIYARKLKERGVITEDEEQRLFEGDIIELKEEDKYFLSTTKWKK